MALFLFRRGQRVDRMPCHDTLSGIVWGGKVWLRRYGASLSCLSCHTSIWGGKVWLRRYGVGNNTWSVVLCHTSMQPWCISEHPFAVGLQDSMIPGAFVILGTVRIGAFVDHPLLFLTDQLVAHPLFLGCWQRLKQCSNAILQEMESTLSSWRRASAVCVGR